MSNKLVPEINDTNRLYWEGTALGELRVATCPSCAAKFRMNHAWCPQCGESDLAWQKTAGTGVVTNYTVIHTPPYEAYADSVPYALALVELDEGVRMMANIVDCDPLSVDIGMRVAVTGASAGVFRIDEMEKALTTKFAAESVTSIKVPADDLNSDLHAQADYRAHLITVMAGRAVRKALGEDISAA